MNRKHPIVWFLLLALTAWVGVEVFGMPTSTAQDGQNVDADDAPLGADDVDAIGRALQGGQLVGGARRLADAAHGRATRRARCHTLSQGIAPLRRLFDGGAYDRAERRARRMLQPGAADGCEGVDADPLAAKTRLLLAHLYVETDRPAEALETLEELKADIPVDDYATWLRARALEADGRPGAAADAYGSVYERRASPLRFKARARQALTLVDAERWEEALPVVEHMLETFPDYPRRFRLLYDRAVTLEHLGRLPEAGEAYQTAWFEYPHKPEGDMALAALERLRDQGVDVPPIDRRSLLSRYRDLRRFRHWDLADTLLTKLLEDHATPGGHTEFEHDVLMQLALNAYAPKRNEQALAYLLRLREEWKRGYRAGISIRLVDKYLSRTYARLGRFDEALAALKRTLEGHGAVYRKSELAEFFREHGRHEQAFQLVDSYYSGWRKRRWHYAWLLYRTGRFERAIDRFDSQIQRRRGQAKARAMYWKARTLERLGKADRARTTYRQLVGRYQLSYYGIQAQNRLLDQRQRNSVDGVFHEHTQPIVAKSDTVLREMEAAAESLETRRPVPEHDPSMIPKTGNVDRLAAIRRAARQCATGAARDPTFCQLLAGEVPRHTSDMLDRLLAPGRAPTGYFFGGLHALQTGSADPEVIAATEGAAPAVDVGDALHRPAPDTQTPRVDWSTRARIYWKGRFDSEAAFAKFDKGRPPGPMPRPLRAYADPSYIGGLDRATAAAGELFPELVRADWLYDIGMKQEARRAIRDVGLEYKALSAKGRPPAGDPHELNHRRWTYYVDYRRDGRGYWSYQGEEVARFPVPEARKARRELAARQRRIVERRDELRPLLIDAMKEVGDYHFVRQFTFNEGQWYHKSPSGPARHQWTEAYPRAFPELVVEQATKHGINPYLIWSLMTVESTYNPDSISPADAIGLLQVIPRTGIKVASWIGDEDFGPFDLINEDVAIAQGTHYFSSLVRKFRGQELFAIAGYNGGPHRVADWLKKRGKVPMDEFVEEIPFNQARAYVKKVLRVLNIYLRVYEGRKSLYVGQNVEMDYKPYPNF